MYRDRMFIMPDRVISVTATPSEADENKLVVSRRTLYVNGKEVEETMRWTPEKLDRMFQKYDSTNGGNIADIMKVWQKDPNKYWRYCGCPYDKTL